MRTLLTIAACLLLWGAAPAEARASCRHPAHEPHHGPVVPLVLSVFEAERELYGNVTGTEPGCYLLWRIEEFTPEGEGWHEEVALRFNPGVYARFLTPEIPYGNYACFTATATESVPTRTSNRVCVWPLEEERL